MSSRDSTKVEAAKAGFAVLSRALRAKLDVVASMYRDNASSGAITRELDAIVDSSLIDELDNYCERLHTLVRAPQWVEFAVQAEWMRNEFDDLRIGRHELATPARKHRSNTNVDTPTSHTAPSSSRTSVNSTPSQSRTGARSPHEPLRNVSPSRMVVHAMRELSDTVALSRLPISQPSVFKGDPTEFTAWENSFNLHIDNKPIVAQEKLQLLLQFVDGRARDAIRGLGMLGSEHAYSEARLTLKAEFGHPTIVCNAFRDLVANFPAIRPNDAIGLRRYGDVLRDCEIAADTLGGLRVLDDSRENHKMAAKLPENLQTAWRRKAAGRSLDDPYPNYSEFVRFVREEARIANDPLAPPLTHHAKSEPRASMPDKSKNRAPTQRSFDTKVKPDPCAYCKGTNHDTASCFKLKKAGQTEKMKLFHDKSLCFGCANTGHRSENCPARATCKECKKSHPTCLHRSFPPASEGESATTNEVSTRLYPDMLSMIVPVRVSSGGGPAHTTYALLDTQSDASFITEELAKQVKAPFIEVGLTLSTMSNSRKRITCKRYSSIQLQGMDGKQVVNVHKAYERRHIPANRDHIPTPERVRGLRHLKKMSQELSPLLDIEVGMLIGYDCPLALAPLKTILGKADEPFAVRTTLGWCVIKGSALLEGDHVGVSHTISTSISESTPHKSCFVSRTTCSEQAALPTADAVLKALNRDFIEGKPGPEMSIEDRKFLDILSQGVHTDALGYCEMPLPFRELPPTNHSRATALNRFVSNQRKLERDPKGKEQYHLSMDQVIRAGEAEIVPADELDNPSWYIPHFGVRSARKDKLRVVYDCSASTKGASLNDFLLPGPDLLNGLTGILMRFRTDRIAFACDIQKMFHMFRVNPEHRDYLRFLWFDELNEVVDYRMTVHLFGATSSPGCATFGLRHVAAEHSGDVVAGARAARFIQSGFYVDDGLTSVATTEEAKELFTTTQNLLKKNNMRLHKVLSNDADFLSQIPQEDRGFQSDTLELSQEQLGSECALGLRWDLASDTFQFTPRAHTSPNTRRGILSTVMSIYDPLGFVSPCVLEGKVILQEMCRMKVGWDEALDPSLTPRWESWLSTLSGLSKVVVDRCHEPPDFGTVQSAELHHFADASEAGYGACSYLRLINQDGVVHTSLAFSKSRVAALKATTIPRLELQAAVTAAKAGNLLERELTPRWEGLTSHYWSDSMVVLGYVNNEAKRFHTYVANRVQDILDLTKPTQWHHVSGQDNPADMASRGVTPTELMRSCWFTGPDFLRDTTVTYPDTPIRDAVHMPEARTCNVTEVNEVPPNILSRVGRFSSWRSAVRAFTVLRRSARRKRGLPAHSPVEDEAKTAAWLIRLCQRDTFEEIHSLSEGGVVPKSSRISQLDPLVDSEGTLRVGGRLRRSTHLTHEQTHPAVLPKKGHVTELVVRDAHERVSHMGRGTTLQKLRDLGFWVIGGRGVASSCVNKCVRCKRLRGTPHGQKMADLPQDRVSPAPPFAYSGCDVFGPFLIREGRKTTKRYALLFTCMASRAVHLEMLHDMTTDCFLNAFRRMQALRGRVRHLRCDQGTNFVGAAAEMKRQVSDRLRGQDCDFEFNPPNASHMGGAWERQIRTARSALSGLLSSHSGRLDSESLSTLLYECAYLVNSRPLSIEDTEDPMGEPITPNMLLHCRSEVLLPPPGRFETRECYGRKRWRQVQALTNEFWTRWSSTYLQERQSRSKWPASKRNLKPGDTVLVMADDLPRGQWRVGRITQVKVSADGLARSAHVQMAGDLDRMGRLQGPPRVFERPVHRLVTIMSDQGSD